MIIKIIQGSSDEHCGYLKSHVYVQQNVIFKVLNFKLRLLILIRKEVQVIKNIVFPKYKNYKLNINKYK